MKPIFRNTLLNSLGVSCLSVFLTVDVAHAREWWVDANDPSASDSNGGVVGAPLLTIKAAARQAQPGDVVKIRAGTYRETIAPTYSGRADAPIRYEAVDPGRVIVSGADPLDDWQRVSSGDPIYASPWTKDYYWSGSQRNHPAAAAPVGYAEQVIYKGVPLKQVAADGDLRPGTFYADWDADQMKVWLPGGADPAAGGVEAATRQVLMYGTTSVQHIHVQGLTFRHGANFAQRGLVHPKDHWRLSDVTVEWAAGGGIRNYGDNVLIENTVTQFNGQIGINGSGSDVVLRDVVTRGNNREGYHPDGEAGGGKWVFTDNLLVERMVSYDNQGIGFWIDIENQNYTVRDSVFFSNIGPADRPDKGFGLVGEISPGPGLFEGNLFYANGGSGIGVWEAAGVEVRDNTFIDDTIQLRDISRVMNPGENWNVLENILIHNNRFVGDSGIRGVGDELAQFPQHVNIVANENTYDLNPGVPFAEWGQFRFTTFPSLVNLQWERDGQIAGVPITLPSASRFGDMDRDFLLTNRDIDLLAVSILDGLSEADLNADGAVDAADLDFFVRGVLSTAFGDANLDGRVDGSDLLRLQANLGRLGGWYDGDFNGDGLVTLADQGLLQGNLGFDAAPYPTFADAILIPQPAAGTVPLAAVALVFGHRPPDRSRRRSNQGERP